MDNERTRRSSMRARMAPRRVPAPQFRLRMIDMSASLSEVFGDGLREPEPIHMNEIEKNIVFSLINLVKFYG